MRNEFEGAGRSTQLSLNSDTLARLFRVDHVRLIIYTDEFH